MQIESELHKINISINKAKITRVIFTFPEEDDGLPQISVQLALISVGGNKVTEVDLSTSSWNKNTKLPELEIPIDVYDKLGHIVKGLSPVCIRKVNSIDRILT